VSSPARSFIVRKICETCVPIFALVIHDCSYLYRLARWPRATSVIVALNVVFESSVPLT